MEAESEIALLNDLHDWFNRHSVPVSTRSIVSATMAGVAIGTAVKASKDLDTAVDILLNSLKIGADLASRGMSVDEIIQMIVTRRI